MKTKTIPVKWMREARSGRAIRFRYAKRMVWIPKWALVDFDDHKFWYYNEELEITVKEKLLKRIHLEHDIHNEEWGW